VFREPSDRSREGLVGTDGFHTRPGPRPVSRKISTSRPCGKSRDSVRLSATCVATLVSDDTSIPHHHRQFRTDPAFILLADEPFRGGLSQLSPQMTGSVIANRHRTPVRSRRDRKIPPATLDRASDHGAFVGVGGLFGSWGKKKQRKVEERSWTARYLGE
jgi:hypothetical protein